MKMVGHIPEPLPKILSPLMKCCKKLKTKVEISGEKWAAPERNWVLGGGIEGRIHKLHVRKVILNADAEQG